MIWWLKHAHLNDCVDNKRLVVLPVSIVCAILLNPWGRPFVDDQYRHESNEGNHENELGNELVTESERVTEINGVQSLQQDSDAHLYESDLVG